MTARHTSTLEALLIAPDFDGEAQFFEPLSRHTSYRIGGPAHFLARADSLHSLRQLVDACQAESIDWVILGKGTNLLVSDEGFEGLAIVLGRDFKSCIFDEAHGCFTVGAAFPLAALVQEAFKRGVAGLEFAVGTPGTLGGAVRMNAGSRDEWLGSSIVSVTTFSPGHGLRMYKGEEIAWGYRTSSLPHDEIVVECEIAVKSAPTAAIREKMEASLARRRKTQPLDYPSCGSVFKNPEGLSAGKLIEDAGLKGMTSGDAMVSTVHANFIVNTGNARAEDIRTLIDMIRKKIQEDHGIELQTEVRFLGFREQ